MRTFQTSLLTVAVCLSWAQPVQAEQKLTDQLTLGGVLEVDAFYSKDDNAVDTVDMAISILEVGLDANISEQVSISTLFVYEDGYDALEVDTAILNISLSPDVQLSVGQMTLPFGRYETAALSDPLTLELGETADSGALITTTFDALSVSAAVFNGSNQKTADLQGDDHLTYLLSLDYSSEGLDAGLSWLSSLESGSLIEIEIEDSNGAIANDLSDYVSGIGAYLIWRSGPITASFEHISALDDYQAGDFSGVVTEASQPSASVAEIAWAMNEDATIALAVQQSKQALFVGLPEQQVLASYTRSLQNGLDAGLEISQRKDYSIAKGGSGESTQQLLLRLSAAF